MPDSKTPHLAPPAATGRTAAGLLCVALATLMYEVLLTRIFSVTMWYHFAFVAISIAMLGMTVGALIIYVRPEWFPPEAAKRQLAVTALLFPVLMFFSFLTQLSIPFRVHPSVVAAYAIAFTYAVITVPFVASGMAVCLALTRFPRDVGKLYAADLIGAALGCVLLVWVLEITDGPTSVLVICALAALGTLTFAFDTDRRSLRDWSLALAPLLRAAASGHTVLVRHQRGILRILYVKAGFEARPLYERWNSYSRVRVNGDPNKLEEPYAWGLSPTFPADRKFYQLHLDIDTAAGTVITKDTGNPADFDHLKYDVTNIGYYIRPNGRVLVIGVGGGRDILSALLFGAREVTGVELNRNILDTVNGRFGDFSGHLDRNPRVHFVNDEARSFVARGRECYDFMQISLIDTWAATAAGAFVLSENALYTVEAWDLFLEHLSDNGLLSVSRWYYQSRPGEVYRLTALASASLLRRGIANPQQHMMIIRSLRGSDHSEGEGPDGIGTLLLSPSPIAAQDVARLEVEARRLQFEVVVSPTFAADDTFARLASGRDLDAFTRNYPINIAAPTDDSPFFFNMLRLRDVAHPWMTSLGKSTHNMEAVFVLGTLLITVIVLTLLCIFLPLKLTTDPGALRGAGPLLTFFASIGLGFMLIETSQMQRLIVVLGHPTYGLTVVLFALLLSGGLGSWLTNRVPIERAADAGRIRLIVLVALLLLFGILTPAVADSLQRAETPVRVIASALMLGVPGLFMGMAFPLGMKLASQRFNHLTPWFWGTNGATSVCASVLAVAIALSWSISAAFWPGCGAYAIGLGAFAAAGARSPVPAERAAKYVAAL